MAIDRSRKKRQLRALVKKSASASSQSESFFDHPAGYRVGAKDLATLREVLDPAIPTLSLRELGEEQRVELVVARLRAKPEDYSISMIGPGAINKARAIAEVQARSRVGRTLIEIEQLIVAALAAQIRSPG